jgi:hypothetical protein
LTSAAVATETQHLKGCTLQVKEMKWMYVVEKTGNALRMLEKSRTQLLNLLTSTIVAPSSNASK